MSRCTVDRKTVDLEACRLPPSFLVGVSTVGLFGAWSFCCLGGMVLAPAKRVLLECLLSFRRWEPFATGFFRVLKGTVP